MAFYPRNRRPFCPAIDLVCKARHLVIVAVVFCNGTAHRYSTALDTADRLDHVHAEMVRTRRSGTRLHLCWPSSASPISVLRAVSLHFCYGRAVGSPAPLVDVVSRPKYTASDGARSTPFDGRLLHAFAASTSLCQLCACIGVYGWLQCAPSDTTRSSAAANDSKKATRGQTTTLLPSCKNACVIF